MKDLATMYAMNVCIVHGEIVFIKIVTREVRGKGVTVWYVPKDMSDECLLEDDTHDMPATWRLNLGIFDG